MLDACNADGAGPILGPGLPDEVTFDMPVELVYEWVVDETVLPRFRKII